MSEQSKSLYVDFALLMLGMCHHDMLPNLDSCMNDLDMSDLDVEDPEWVPEYLKRITPLQQRVIEDSPLGMHFIGKGYSWVEVRDFVMDLQSERLANALKILFPIQ